MSVICVIELRQQQTTTHNTQRWIGQNGTGQSRSFPPEHPKHWIFNQPFSEHCRPAAPNVQPKGRLKPQRCCESVTSLRPATGSYKRRLDCCPVSFLTFGKVKCRGPWGEGWGGSWCQNRSFFFPGTRGDSNLKVSQILPISESGNQTREKLGGQKWGKCNMGMGRASN